MSVGPPACGRAAGAEFVAASTSGRSSAAGSEVRADLAGAGVKVKVALCLTGRATLVMPSGNCAEAV
jgi:hypothetical protein